ncbi:hypothetical protein [Desulfoferrobacter suflitae]|uniref:hypothetical protein n=1 Tax=Desulfoferrobacter suflitae TaxID=2865782 RepID=UPI0021641499|nr:hypothetical protein [Desulfoferrobacter suflitae]MCK8602241.1 hypothetical protein [Desulfoferrobacter suflitae]
MKVNLKELSLRKQDYYVASWEDNQLVMEPFCHCGNSLDEDYFCRQCDRKCHCNFVVCADPQSLSVVEKLIHGNPKFRDYEVSLLDEQQK